jgi:hypothetical protein
VDFSPRVDPRLVAAVRMMDVERMSVAEIWRSTGLAASRLGLCRPGYHSVLRIALDERQRRAARREAIVQALDELWAYTGTDYEALVRRLAETRRA